MNKALKIGLLPVMLFANSELVNATAPGLYFGGGAGVSSLQPQAGFYKEKENGLSGRLFLGYNFNHFLGIETNYSAFEKTKYIDDNYPLFSGDYKLDAISLVGKLYFPFTDESPLNIYVLAGAAQVYGDFELAYGVRKLTTLSAQGIVPTAGVGINYDFTPHITGGIEVSGLGKIEHEDRLGVPSSALATLSFAYKF